MPPQWPSDIQQLPGLVATVITSGVVDDGYAACLREMARHNDKEGFFRVEYKDFPATLVENGRDEAIKHALTYNYAWCLQVDADMVFPPHALLQLLHRAFIEIPVSDAVGAYCQLKGPPHLPTIDTGTGTWEPHYPGEGVLEAIRTGAAFLLTKTSLFSKFGPPWFRSRLGNRPLDAFQNVDNFARCKLGGQNPFASIPEWATLVAEAKAGWQTPEHSIGEDSGFCDRAKAAGARLFVDTDLEIGHVRSKEVIRWQHLKNAMAEREKVHRLACGILE